MRILFIGAAPRPDNMEQHVISTLSAMGHDVLAFDARSKPSSRWTSRTIIRRWVTAVPHLEPERQRENALIGAAGEYQPDLVIALLGSMVSPQAIDALKASVSCPVVCWCQDQMTTLGQQYLIGARYDKIFLKDQYLVRLFRDMCDLPTHYLAEACNPAVHRTIEVEPGSEYECDICTYGSLYYYRQAILEALTGYNVKVWGTIPDWMINRVEAMTTGRGVFELEKCKALGAAKIVLNTLHYGEIDGLNARCFEAAGCGAFQLMSYSQAVERHFEVGREIAVFRNRGELIEQIDYYLARPDERRQIAAAAQARAYREHTYEQRLRELIDVACAAEG